MGLPGLTESFGRRPVPDWLEQRYKANGTWQPFSFGESVLRWLRKNSESKFVVLSNERPYRGRFRDIARMALRFAGYLMSKGIGPGDSVAFQFPNWMEGAVVFYGAALAGCCNIPIPYFYGTREVAHILSISKPRLFAFPKTFGSIDYLENADVLASLISEVDTVLVLGTGHPYHSFEAAMDYPEIHSVPLIDPTSASIIGFTSGTLTEPKGVVHSHRTLLSEAHQMNATFPPGPPSINGAPIGHAIGTLGTLVIPLMREKAVYTTDVWYPRVVLNTMLEERASSGNGAPLFLLSLLDSPHFDKQHIRLMPHVGLGGSPAPENLIQRAEKMGIRVLKYFGTTEHPSISATRLQDPEWYRIHSDGLPMPGVEIGTIDESGAPLAAYAVGEIVSRGPDLCEGYVSNQLTTKQFDSDGWFHTGDFGYIDEKGYLFIKGRILEIIVRGGETISATEIEAVLKDHPAVADIAVGSVPDSRYGEKVVAFVKQASSEVNLGVSQLRSFGKSRGMAPQKLPEQIINVTDIPRTTMGKIQRSKLKDLL